MKINFSNVLYVVIGSSIIALLINFLRPDGLPLKRESKSLTWADSSHLNDNINKDSAVINGESQAANEENLMKNSKAGDDTLKNFFKEPIAINLKQAYKLYKKNIVFLDARDHEDYKEGHIKNALNLPFYDFEKYKDVLNNIPKNSALVTYCAGTDCDLSILLGNQLFDSGYKKVYIFFGGWNDWLNAEYPMEKISNL